MAPSQDLLQPSLSGPSAGATSIYSATTGYLAAFLGGPIGGAVIALVNSRRLNRLGTDWWIGILAVGATAALFWWEQRAGGRDWLVAQFGAGGPGFAIRLLGLAFFGLIYALHRPHYRTMQMVGIEPPSGWLIGFVAIATGVFAIAALTGALMP